MRSFKSIARSSLAFAVLATIAIGVETGTASASAGRQVQLNYAVVTEINRSAKSLDIVRKNNSTVFTIVYSNTTYFYGSRLSAIKVGTVLTIAGLLSGTTLTAQKISTRKPASGGTYGLNGGSLGVNGPFAGLKYVGNV